MLPYGKTEKCTNRKISVGATIGRPYNLVTNVRFHKQKRLQFCNLFCLCFAPIIGIVKLEK